MKPRCRFAPCKGGVGQYWFLNGKWSDEPGYIWSRKEAERIKAQLKREGKVIVDD